MGGYEALLAIIQMDHPIYHHHPTSFIRAPPRQRKAEALSAHFYRYVDYLRLRVYLKNINTNLSNASSELDDFINVTFFEMQYHCLIREDQKSQSPNVLVQFSQNRIVGTLNRLLANYNDEFKPKERCSLRNNGVQGGKNLLPQFQHIQQLHTNAKHMPQRSTTPRSKPSKINSIAMNPSQPLLNLEEPPGLTEFEPVNESQENYKQAVINNVKRDPREFNTSKLCLVCNKPQFAQRKFGKAIVSSLCSST